MRNLSQKHLAVLLTINDLLSAQWWWGVRFANQVNAQPRPRHFYVQRPKVERQLRVSLPGLKHFPHRYLFPPVIDLACYPCARAVEALAQLQAAVEITKA